jgi:GNAT superfamily N-acetyltransferase
MAMVLPLMLSMTPNFTRVKFSFEGWGHCNHAEANTPVWNAGRRITLDIEVMTLPTVDGLHFVAVGQHDDLAEPLLAELAVEYATRYGGTADGVGTWLRGYPADEFEAPSGGMLIGLLPGVQGARPVTGGAFRRFDEQTAELKRIWTDSGHRRRGLARALLLALEAEIAGRGYQRIYLTTGDRQPEAEALYLATGYRKLTDPLPAEGEVYPMAFLKELQR